MKEIRNIFIMLILFVFILGCQNTGGDPTVQGESNYYGYIKSKTNDNSLWCTYMINSDPSKFLGHKIKLSALIRTQDVIEGVRMFLELIQKKNLVSFDNIWYTPIQGTTNWKNYEIILESPKNASNIAYGFMLSGTGYSKFKI